MENTIVVACALLIIGFIIWWFFGARETKSAIATTYDGKQEVEVTVNGGYTPNTVTLKQGVPASIIFFRQDSSNCFNEVMFPDFGIHEPLPINTRRSIEIDTTSPGEYQYSCGMSMFHGKIIIK